MAKLKRILEPSEYNALDSNHKADYTEREGKYHLDVDDSPALSALEAERQAKKALEAKLAGYGDLSPEQVKKLQDETAKATREKDFAAGNFEKILAEERAKHAKDLELREQAEQRLRASLKSALIDAEAVRELAAQGGSADLLLPIIQSRATLQTVGDREVAVIVGDKGGPRLKAGAKSAEDYMPMGEFVAELKADKRYAGAFAAGVGSGSGSSNNANRTPPHSSTGRPSTAAKAARILEQIKANPDADSVH